MSLRPQALFCKVGLSQAQDAEGKLLGRHEGPGKCDE